MIASRGTLFDEVLAKLPLFEDLPEDVPERLVGAGLGRGLLTASVRGRLRKAGFIDMGRLAIATPAELAEVRKIGPVRIDAIRTHVLDEVSRLHRDARAAHTEAATRGRRLDRLRAMPAERLTLDQDILERLGRGDGTCADVASKTRLSCVRTLGMSSTDLDGVVVTLARFLLPERPTIRPILEPDDSDLAQEQARVDEERARFLRDREWEEAAPRQW